MHHETMTKAAEAERRNEEAKRKRNDAKNEALRARLAHEQQLNEQRNMRKASEASEKIMNASRMRQAQTAQAEAAFQVRRTLIRTRTRTRTEPEPEPEPEA